MKKIIMSFMSIASIAAILTISSCAKDDACKSVTCQNAGTCVDGTCHCALGYEGTHCDSLVRTKYIGASNGGEVCTSDPTVTTPIAVTVAIVAGDVTKVTFTNLYGAGFVTTGTVQSDGTIIIASQAFGTGTISGTASIVSGKLKIMYVITSGGSSDSCTWTQS
jgi:hypothetical protein